MTHKVQTEPDYIARLRAELKQALSLDLDELGLIEADSGEYESTFIGVHLKTAFQPIYDTKQGEIYGYEALIRPSLFGTLGSTPEFAFTYAEQAGKLVQFDRVCRSQHVLNFRAIHQENGLLFLNVHPKLLIEVNAHGKVFEQILHKYSVPTERVVLEIKESLVEQDKQLLPAIENYRALGYRLWAAHHDFIKFDISVIHQAAQQPALASALRGLVHSVQDLGSTPVIVGIETQQQLDIAVAAGANVLQGNFLAEPVVAKVLNDQYRNNGRVPRVA
ncbi:EAL domain-containing protein [Methylophilus aquaticus]|uniref:EAL domain-containing protein n=1 Tax=Methylophilus aquaticus TaxID=1971610 RepID=A0ABT9JRP4_9PROT|nr:EAL domain-containing protein [Methylophilus aquaticus]MDP8567240.1 EAL domain-containing protein [Methylophilus aquaticus]